MRIGIPRGFYYYSYPGLWEAFFRELGHDPVVSEPTSRATLELAATDTEAEHCLPHKIFDGHVLSLLPKVDAVFIPRIISTMKGHICCPRFGALPDASKARVAHGHRVIAIEFNETREPLKKTLVGLGLQLGANKRTAELAAQKAISHMAELEKEDAARQHVAVTDKKFLLLGHPYTLHDPFIAAPITRKLKVLRVPVELMTFEEKNIEPGQILWCTFHKMFRRLQSLDMNIYAGVIQITTFNCGADSMMTERFRRMCRKSGVPYMLLMVDEHTGRAGVDTRLEAFVDSLSWRGTGAP